MNILSLFDGMSCGQIALKRAGVKIDNYFASEIDKYTIQITQKNYPNTIQLGDINNWREWNLPKIDLLMGGSPCQGFSNAGLGLNFDDPRSKLFFIFVDILNYCKDKNPNSKWLLENVKMKKEWQDIISDILGIQPILINSALVSAQNRKRLYWTNILGITQPKDKHIYLKDILENNSDINLNNIRSKSKTIRIGGRKSPLNSKQEWDNIYVKTIPHGYMKENVVEREKYPSLVGQDPSTKYLIQVGEANIKGHDIIKRIYSPDGKSLALTNMQGGHRQPKISEDTITWRKLTSLECERLQTVPDNYTEGVSNTQRYKMLGNGWTVDVIAHVLNFMKY